MASWRQRSVQVGLLYRRLQYGFLQRRLLATAVDGQPASVEASLQPPNKEETITETIQDKQEEARNPRRTLFMYYDTVWPIRFGLLDQRVLYSRLYQEPVLADIRRTIPQDSSEVDVQVEDVISREKDGGVFVKLSYLPPDSTKYQSNGKSIVGESIEKWLRKKVAASNVQYKPWFVFGPQQIHLVKGEPWLEDMDRFPNSDLKLEFGGSAAVPSQEKLYELFRPYGRIRDISTDAKSATITYRAVRSATAARNCMDGFVLDPKNPNQIVHILYAYHKAGSAIWDWMSSHPRITIPVLAVVLGGLSYLIFDPIRSFFVKSKVAGTFEPTKYRAVAWLKKETLDRFRFASNSAAAITQSGIEKERQEATDVLENWLKDLPDGFITVTGPRGSGKSQLLGAVTKNHPRTITIDCEAILKKAETDDKMVQELARQLGYFPFFGFLSSFNNLIDLASVGLIGSKAGFSQSADAQLKQVLAVSADAMSTLAADARRTQKLAFEAAEDKRKTKDFRDEARVVLEREGLKDGRIDAIAGNGAMSELGRGVESEDGLQSMTVAGPQSLQTAKSILTDGQETEALASEAEGLPVVILKGFNSKGRSKDMLWDALAEWGATLVENKIAHVIASSDNVLLVKPLAKALPSRPLNSIALADANTRNAIDYITTKLTDMGKGELLTPANEEQIARLGGRLSDLEILTQKLQANSNVDEAVEDIISRSVAQVKKDIFDEEPSKEWTKAQVWYLTQLFSQSEEASYEDVLFNGPFKGNEKPLRALEQAEMVSVTHRDGHPSIIRPGRPVWRAAFQRLTSDTIFSAVQELVLNTAAITTAEGEIKSASDELVQMTALFPASAPGKFIFTGSSSVPVEVAARVDSLLAKMRASQIKLEKLKGKESELKAILAKKSSV